MPGCPEETNERLPHGGSTPMADMQGTSRIGADVFDQYAPALPQSAVTVLGPLGFNMSQNFHPEIGLEREIKKSRPRDIDPREQCISILNVIRDNLSNFKWRPSLGSRQRHGHRAGHIAPLRPLWRLEVNSRHLLDLENPALLCRSKRSCQRVCYPILHHTLSHKNSPKSAWKQRKLISQSNTPECERQDEEIVEKDYDNLSN